MRRYIYAQIDYGKTISSTFMGTSLGKMFIIRYRSSKGLSGTFLENF